MQRGKWARIYMTRDDRDRDSEFDDVWMYTIISYTVLLFTAN